MLAQPRPLAVLIASLCLVSPLAAQDAAEALSLDSPGGQLRIAVRLDENGRPVGDVTFQKTLVVSAAFGLRFADSAALEHDLKIVGTSRASRDETYAIPVGKASSARDRHQELIVTLEEGAALRRRYELVCRAFDDGVAFRYRIPRQAPLDKFVLIEERTRFTFPSDPQAHALPLNGTTTSYEKYYEKRPLSELGTGTLLGLPLLLERRRGEAPSVWLAVTEANLTDYAGMYLAPVAGSPGTLAARLSPLPNRTDGASVLGRTPHDSPWRVLMISDSLGQLLESNLVFHLSEPSAIKDTSWIKPGKTTFPWWNAYVLPGVDFTPGLNTATYKYYIDFCAENGIEHHSLDGTDKAWYGGPITPDGPTDITKAVPEIDLPELLRYAQEKGVRLRLWMHWLALKRQIDEAFPLYEKWGIQGVMVDFMDRDDQEMVAFYHEVAKKAAQHHLTVTWHGAYKPTGMERTWPNVLNYEAALNQEYNKWDARGTPPEHNLDIAFVRMLAGPLDYHQGGMRNVLPQNFQPRYQSPFVQGTRGHQLAMYVVYQNHLPMLADYPSAYRGQPDLAFLARIPCTWDETRVLHAQIDRCLVIARRNGDQWYLGGMAGSQRQELSLPLTILGDGPYEAEIFQDDPTGGPTALTRRQQAISSNVALRVELPAAGGFVARLTREKR